MKRLVAVLPLLLAGCGEMSSYAVPTTSGPLGPRPTSVAIYATRPPPPGAREIGIVEAKALGDDATVEKLVPVLVSRAADLGANALVVDFVGAKVEDTTFVDPRTAAYPGETLRVEQVFVVVLRGRAFVVPETKEGGPS